MEPIRAFIAVELPSSVKLALSQLQGQLKQNEHAYVRWVNPDSIHLTLKFLGDIDTGKIPELANAISKAAKGATQFQLELGKLGTFPNIRAPRVVWVGLGGEISTLSAIQENIESALIPLGFPSERRPFSPHLTLGRVREGASPNERRRLGEVVAGLKTEAAVHFTVDSLNLMRSILSREGALYSCLSSVALRSS